MFLQRVRIEKLTREIGQKAAEVEAPDPESPMSSGSPSSPLLTAGVPVPSPPKVLSSDVIATRRNSKEFGKMLAARGWSLGMFASSRVKLLNHRVKGSEKFWSECGAEALLQLKADTLSDTGHWKHFWHTRPNTMTGTRPSARSKT